jgi:hypothetical protein
MKREMEPVLSILKYFGPGSLFIGGFVVPHVRK